MAGRDHSTHAATAIVLAGGRSSRMGRPKALLPFGDRPLIEHLVAGLRRVVDEVVVVAAVNQSLPVLEARVVRDEVEYQGPVGGLVYGLRAASHELSFVSSCDAPLLNLALVTHFLTNIDDYDVAVGRWQARLQPLHAVYRQSVLPRLEEQLARGELRPVFLFEKVRTRIIPESEIRRIDPHGLSFLNVNTPDDYQKAVELWNAQRKPR